MGLLSGVLGDIMGTDDAAQAASDANYLGIKAEREMFDLSRGDMLAERDRVRAEGSPWASLGLAGYENYTKEANKGFTFDLASDPVYQERIKELDKNIASGMSAKGMKLSGSTLGALRDATATEIGSAYGRQFDKYQANLSNIFQGAQLGGSMQQGMWGIGSNMTQNMASQAMTHGGNVAQGYQNLGAIQAQQATAPFQNLMAMGQTAGLALMLRSDRRLKTDITHVGHWTNGLPVYTFKYLWDNKTIHTGFMADEVEKIHPEAVMYIDGYKAVDYSKAVL